MFKYCWIVILAVVWIIWLITTVIDVIRAYRDYGFCLDLWDDLEDSSQIFIALTLLGLFIVSFISWISQFINVG